MGGYVPLQSFKGRSTEQIFFLKTKVLGTFFFTKISILGAETWPKLEKLSLQT